VFLSSITLASYAQTKPAIHAGSPSRGGVPQKPTANIYEALDKKTFQIPDSSTATTQQIATYFNHTFSRDNGSGKNYGLRRYTAISYSYSPGLYTLRC
jgi:hypothetical protein